MPADIEVRNIINIAGRGLALIGYVVGGAPKVGQVTGPIALGVGPPRVLTVVAVERLSSMQAGAPAVGLVFSPMPLLPDIQRALPPGAALHLAEPLVTDDRME